MRKLKLVAALGWTLTILISCLASAQNISSLHLPFLGYDKILHTSIYFILVILWCLYFTSFKTITNKLYTRIALLAFAYGILIEVLQKTLTDDRSADILDVVANTVGIITATIVFYTYKRSQIR